MAGETDDLASLFDAYRVFYGCKSDQATCSKFLLKRFNHGESILFLALQESQAVGFGSSLAVGAIRLSLSTGIQNASVQALYEKAGWRRDTDFYVYHCQV